MPMSAGAPEVRWFKPILTIIGVLYVSLGASMLVRGPVVMREFAVPEGLVSSPVFADFFLFFYQLMMFIGVLTALFGWLVRERRAQLIVARFFCAANVLLTLRDLSTSDSRLGNHLYRGSATLIPVFIDVALTLTFGALALGGRRQP